MYIYKFGGTSVGSAERMHHVHELVTRDEEQKIVVLSAVSGTTNSLVEISEHFANGSGQTKQLVNQLKAKYQPLIEALYQTKEGVDKGKEVIDRYFGELEKLLSQPYYNKMEKVILAQGELISTQLFTALLKENGIKAELLPALDFMYIDENGEPDLRQIEERLTRLISSLADVDIIVTQGYICRNNTGGIDNLRRGGSDYTATLIGAAIKAREVQIWTDIDGVHNNDPRIVENTRPIAQLSFEEAGELAYFGAKVLHPNCIFPAQQRNVPVRLKNTMDPSADGTLITSEKNPQAVKAIAVKDGITAIKIKSTRMVLAYGFLRKVFEVFEKYKTPVDMITTSEIAVSLSIDNPEHLEEIIRDISPYGYIEVDREQSIVCIVGDFVAERKGVGKDIFRALEQIPVRMISYGGSKNNISVLIDTQFKKEALITLNKELFNL
ncbi:MAG: aspartate kinase [Bacteroidota bacterium]